MSQSTPSDSKLVSPIGSSDGNSPHFAIGPGSTSATSTTTSTSTKRSIDSDLESQLIDQTRTQIRALAQEISDLANSDIESAEFYQGFLTRLTSALASTGGAIWVFDNSFNSSLGKAEDQVLKLQYQINLKQSVLASDPQAQHQHSLLLHQLIAAGEPQLISPHSGSQNPDEAANPTDSLLVVAPIRIGKKVVGVVEIFQRANAGPTTQHGYLRFVSQMAELASDYLTNRHLQTFNQAQELWQQTEQFMRFVHQGLDTQQTVYNIANEGRRLLGVDRLSVALSQGKKCRVEAVSGLDSLERRADQIKRLGKLVAAIVRAGQPLWYNGDDTDLPPQIERKLHEYIDRSHSKMLAIIPLRSSQPSFDTMDDRSVAKPTSRPLGAIVIEQLKDSQIEPALQQRAELMVKHSQIAISNAQEHQSIFLMPLWKGIGRLMDLFGSRKRWKTMAVVGAVAALVSFLCLFPYRFGMGASGSLIPETQYEVFALENGVLQNIYVSDQGDTVVRAGDLLAEMYNNEIDIEIENLKGQVEQELDSLRSKRALQSQVSAADAQVLAPEINSIMQRILSLENELALREHQQKLLKVTAPAGGQVINWQVRQNLLRRPVQRGQHLMTIVPPDTQWQVELRIPERRVSHVLQAMRENDQPLKVTFALMSHPGTEYMGRILYVDQKLDVHADDGNTTLVRIGFNDADVPRDLLRAGTRVAAKIDCGQRSIGYVFFHELFETVQTKWLLWF